MPDDAFVELAPAVRIRRDELVWRFSGSGGPGGQHANTANTRVELVWDIAASPTVRPHTKARLVAKLGERVRIVATDERSQRRNRDLALSRLRSQVGAALVVPRSRQATKPSKSSQQRRVATKQQRGTTKRLRRRPGTDD